MVYIFMLFMACCGFYTLTYAISLWRDDKNKVGGVAVAMFAIVGTIVPGIVLFFRNT